MFVVDYILFELIEYFSIWKGTLSSNWKNAKNDRPVKHKSILEVKFKWFKPEKNHKRKAF